MGALKPNYKCWARGKSLETGGTVYGNYVQMLIDSTERPHIYPFPMHANSGNHACTPDPVEVDPESVQRYTGLADFNGDPIYEGDVVEIPGGQRGEACYELGTWGVGIPGMVDWQRLSDIAQKEREIVPNFLFNDNFISFYELIDNFCLEDSIEECCNAVCIIPDGWEEEEEIC